MKRKLFVSMLIIGVLSFVACGSESSSAPDTQTNIQTEKEEVKEEKKDNKKEEVSMDALRNHEVSPTSDFQFRLASGNYEIEKYLGDDEIVVIPEEYEGKKVVGIVSMVFGEDSGVKAVKLSDSVEYIAGSFLQNKDLEYVICGKGLKEIRQSCFGYCTSLKEIEIYDGLEIIGSSAFINNYSLREIYLPQSIVEIAPANFLGMSEEGFTFKCKAASYAEESAKEFASAYGYGIEAVE